MVTLQDTICILFFSNLKIQLFTRNLKTLDLPKENRRSSEGRVDLGIIQWWYKEDDDQEGDDQEGDDKKDD